MMSDEQTHRHGAFFGRRKGHPLRARQAELFETLLPRLAVDLSTPARDLAALFPGPVDDIHLEIGFGGAEHLIARAKADPRIGFIGAEPFVNGMAKALAAIDEREARPTSACITPTRSTCSTGCRPDRSGGSICSIPIRGRSGATGSGVSSTTTNIARLARVLRPGGEFRFATDWANYAEWTLARLMRARDFAWTAERADDWRKPWPGFTQTRYEAKAIREGRVPCYLMFRQRVSVYRRHCGGRRARRGAPSALPPSSGFFSRRKRSGSSRGGAAGCGGMVGCGATEGACGATDSVENSSRAIDSKSPPSSALLLAHGRAAPAVDDGVDEVLARAARRIGRHVDDRLALRNEVRRAAA